MARVMKASGIEWIGEIPETWKLPKVKQLFDIGRGRVISQLELEPEGYPVYSSQTKNDGCLGYISTYDFDRSQLTWTTDGANAGTVFLREGKHNCTNVCGTLMPKSNEHDLKYLKYALEYIAIYHKRADINGYKIMNNEMAEIVVTLPLYNEQHRIADFLDRKCAEIDAVIEKTKATIEEYKKLKQSVITEAVTKGIRGNRPMKDSGIEWIAKISETWSMSRIGLHYNIVLGKMLCDKQLTEEYTLEPYFCAANIHFDGVSQEQLKQMWFSPSEKDSYLVQNGDLLVVEGGAGAGGAAIVEMLEQPTYVQNSVMIVRGLAGQTNRYLRYWIECLVKKGYIDVVCNKATIPHFTKDKLATMPVPVVPVEEMEEIADYLDQKCAALDTLIAKKTALLTELETYKKSLIYEYVTGKKEVIA